MKSFFIVAHRGGKSEFSENTLEAFQYGLDHGANAVEMDVRFDHFKERFYLEHDFIHSSKDRENVIDKIVPFLPRETMFFIELKTISWLRKKYALHFLEIFKQYALDKNSLVISFNPFVLWHLRQLQPDIRIGFICGNRFWGGMFQQWLYKILKPQFLLLHRRMLKKPLLNFAQKNAMQVIAFSMNKPEHWLKAKKLNLTGIVTDFPEEAAKVIYGEGWGIENFLL